MHHSQLTVKKELSTETPNKGEVQHLLQEFNLGKDEADGQEIELQEHSHLVGDRIGRKDD